jgi:hypothetical protein
MANVSSVSSELVRTVENGGWNFLKTINGIMKYSGQNSQVFSKRIDNI